MSPYRITAVCLGNICRSPIAEIVLRTRAERAGLADVVVDSAGTGPWHVGSSADSRARDALYRAGYDVTPHAARQFDPAWLDVGHANQPQMVLAMDHSNLRDLRAMIGPHNESLLRMMRSFDPVLADLDADDPELAVPDPYYGGQADYVAVIEMVEAAADGVLDYVQAAR